MLYDFNYRNNDDLGMLCAYLSMIAYENDIKVQEKWLSRFIGNFEILNDTCNKNLQYSIIRDIDKKTIFVAVRGTETHSLKEAIRDLWVSLQFWPIKPNITSDDNTKIHYGYNKAGRALFNKVMPTIHKNYPDHELVFCGHSLGGVLAKYMGLLYASKSKVFAYGAPRLGSKGLFKTNPKTDLHNYVNIMDLIPLFYPKYHDCKDYNYFLTGKSQVSHTIIDSDSYFKPIISLVLKTLFGGKFVALKSHSIKNYIRHLRKLRKK